MNKGTSTYCMQIGILFLKSRKSEIEKKADKIYKKQTLTGKVNRGYTNFSILEKACENYIAK